MLPDGVSEPSADWQRVSVFALLPMLAKSVWELIGLILGGVVLSSRDKFGEFIPYIIAAIAALVIGRALVHWRCSRFRVTPLGIELETGWLNKERLQLPQSRVQELQVRQPFYYRPLQLYAASIDSAGSKKKEFELTGLSEAQLTLLQGQVRAPDAAGSTPFFRIWLATLYNPYLWLPLAALFGFSQQFKDSGVMKWGFHTISQLLLQYDVRHSVVVQLLVAGILLLSVVIGLALMAVVWLYPQHLVRTARQLQLTQGTVVKKSLRISAHRVQLLTVLQPWLARVFGHYSMMFKGFAGDQRHSRFVLLGQTGPELSAQLQAQQLLPLDALPSGELQRFVPAYFRHKAFYLSLLLLGCSALLWQSNIPPLWLKILVPPVLALWWLLDLWLSYRWHGYRVHNDVLYLWQGGISRSWSMLPLKQVQQVRLQQTPYYQRHNMVLVQLLTANGMLKLAAVPNLQAQYLYQQVLALQYPSYAGMPSEQKTSVAN